MDSSSFSDIQQIYPDAELLPVEGSTCDCYRVKLYGKLHFMKRLKSELRSDPRYVSALQKEFETGYCLDHPHLVRYVAKGDDYLLMEYVDGETLAQFTSSHPEYFKSRKNADRMLYQLLDVVGYLHQHQIVHLDLKPENILITRIGHEVKLTDLGYCYTDTYIDTIGRTDKYAAPEQFPSFGEDGHGKEAIINVTTDIYAIGKILQTLPCSHIYNKVIARCTAEDPSKRFQSVEELKRALNPPITLLRYFILIVVLVFCIALFLYYQRPAEIKIITSDAKSEQVADTIATSTERSWASHSQKIQVVPPSTHSSQTEELTSSYETNHRELTNSEIKEIRSITLSVVQPIYQRKIEPIVNRVIQGDFDGKHSYISDSLSKAFVVANEEVFAKLRKINLISKYPNIIEEDVNREMLYAIGDAEYFYGQKVFQHFYPGAKIPSNPFVE